MKEINARNIAKNSLIRPRIRQNPRHRLTYKKQLCPGIYDYRCSARLFVPACVSFRASAITKRIIGGSMRKLLLVFVLIASFSVQFPVSVPAQKRQRAAAAAPKARPGADLITADQMRAYLYFIASDEMEGRDTPSRGLDTTAKFLAMNLTRWGFRPAGDNGTFLQKILLSRARIDPDKTAGEFGGRPLKYGEDFLASNVSGTASGQLVYVGHGWVVKDKDIDP